jgi:hypothetical protein
MYRGRSIPIQAMNFDPERFGPDAMQFRPERWLGEEGEALRSYTGYGPGTWHGLYVLPCRRWKTRLTPMSSASVNFGGGTRSCVGYVLCCYCLLSREPDDTPQKQVCDGRIAHLRPRLADHLRLPAGRAGWMESCGESGAMTWSTALPRLHPARHLRTWIRDCFCRDLRRQ